MALILKNYTNEYGITSDLYVRVDSLHTMFGENVKGTRVAINTSCWYDVSARTAKDSKPLIQNKTWLVNDIPIKDTENMLQVGYQLLKEHFKLNEIIFEEDLNVYDKKEEIIDTHTTLEELNSEEQK